jgi:hypothetical protein
VSDWNFSQQVRLERHIPNIIRAQPRKSSACDLARIIEKMKNWWLQYQPMRISAGLTRTQIIKMMKDWWLQKR